jgi:outer membrane lipoprotein-sorting protein
MKYFQLISVTIILFFLINIQTNAQNADSLLRKMDELMSAPKDRVATMEMIVTSKNDKETIREAQMKQKGKDRKFYRYTKPEKQAGVSTLSLPGDEMWLFMPAFDEPVKITLLSKSQAFTGTDFSYEDMDSRSYSEKYAPTLIKSDDPKYYKLELVPRSKKSNYSKILVTLEKVNHYPIKMEYFDGKGNFFKEATYQYARQGKYWYAKEVLMEDLKKGSSTKIVMKDMKFDQGLSDDEFTLEKMMEK